MKQNFKVFILPFIGAVILALMIFTNPFGQNPSTHREVVENKMSGKVWVQFDQGWYWKGFFSKTTSYPNIVTVQFDDVNNKSTDVTFFSGVHTVKFNGGDDAKIGHIVKWDLPDNDSLMIKIHREYRNYKKLASESLAPFQSETANYATQMMDSETHYSGGRSQLKENFQDQLRKGQILLDRREDITVNEVTGKSENKIIIEPRLDEHGQFVRTKADIHAYGIYPTFVAINYVKYDPLIESKLQAKIESATIKSISEQDLITAQQEALTQIEIGKRDIEKKRATEEADKLEAVIRAQKATAVAEQKALEAKFIADKIEQEGRAKAAANLALVKAGLTPQERAEWDFKTAVGIAEHLSKRPVPMIIMGGEGGGNLSQAYSMQEMITLMDKLNKSK